MPPPHPIAGQASAEYVALLAVVCVVVAGAAAVGSAPPLAGDVVAAVKRGICRVAGGVCTPAEARASGLQPCLVAARAERERLSLRTWIVRLARGDALLVQRRSDGSASVSFTDGGTAGASAGLGLQFAHSGAKARGSVGLQFNAGRTWEFARFEEAARFVRRWGGSETLGGELRGILPGGAHPPRPDSTYVEGGAFGEVAGALGAEAHAEGGGVLGRRVGPGDRTVYYERMDAELGAHMGALFGALDTHEAGELGLEVTVEHGRATQLRLRGAARVHGELVPPGPASTYGDLVSLLQGDPARPVGRGRRAEVDVTLDLTVPENRAAALGVLELARPGVTPGGWQRRVATLAQRLYSDGAVDVRVFRVGLDERAVAGDLALLGGAGYDRSAEVRELLGAWALPPGGTLREREDCVPAQHRAHGPRNQPGDGAYL